VGRDECFARSPSAEVDERLGDEVLVRNDVDTDDRFSQIPIASVVCL